MYVTESCVWRTDNQVLTVLAVEKENVLEEGIKEYIYFSVYKTEPYFTFSQ